MRLIEILVMLSAPGLARAEPYLPKWLYRPEPVACGADRYAQDLLLFAEQGISITKDLAVKDVASFCRAITRNQAQNDSSAMGVSDDRELLQGGAGAWLSAYHPNPAIRIQGFQGLMKLVGNESFRDEEDLRAYLLQPDSRVKDDGYIGLDSPKDRAEMATLNKFGGSGWRQKPSYAAACEELAWTIECPGALAKVVEISIPVDTGLGYTQPQLYKEFLQDGSYGAGLRLAAVKLLDRVKNHDTDAAFDLYKQDLP